MAARKAEATPAPAAAAVAAVDAPKPDTAAAAVTQANTTTAATAAATATATPAEDTSAEGDDCSRRRQHEPSVAKQWCVCGVFLRAGAAGEAAAGEAVDTANCKPGTRVEVSYMEGKQWFPGNNNRAPPASRPTPLLCADCHTHPLQPS